MKITLFLTAVIISAFTFSACNPASAAISTDDAYESDRMAQSCIRASRIIGEYFHAIRDSGYTRSDVIAKVKGFDNPQIPEYLTTLHAVNIADAIFNSGTPKEAHDRHLSLCLGMVNKHIREVK